jgi:sirohydrochlorin cobaltochelatase|tara:strand:+ start:752 stop:1144 length:393 start_codon:yes stop_codon:yes gene_type:complete
MTNQKSANVLLAHGSRDPQWQAPFEVIAERIKTKEQENNQSGESTRIELSYMELSEPSLEQVCEDLAKDGYEIINIYPIFFAAGRHLRIDVPKQLKDIEADLGITTHLHPPVGQEEIVRDAITQVILKQM